MLNSFPTDHPTKVSLYRQLSDDENSTKEGMNPLNEESLRYQYIGEITKTGKFFFEVELGEGKYVCLMETRYKENVRPQFSIFSKHPVHISGSGICSKNSQAKELNVSKMSVKSKKTLQELD